MRRGVFTKMLAVFLLVIATATVTLDLAVRPSWENSLRKQIQQSLVEKTRLFANRVQSDRSRPLKQIASEEAAAANARATIIDASGRVLADSQADPSTMGNHASRPEFAAALHGSVGTATRDSQTIGAPLLYVAVPIQGGAVRMSYPLSDVQAAEDQARRKLLVGSTIALIIAMLLAALIAQLMAQRLQHIVRFAERIANGDLSARIAQHSNDEIAMVASALDRTARKLESSFAAIETSRTQLETLLNSMQEAVIAVTTDGKVLWVNGRMKRLAGAVRIGAPLVETVRDPSVLAAVDEAIKKKRMAVARATGLLPGRVYQVTAAPMPPSGAVAVLHDLTKIERVEKTRRDFIANVSHELRTPLTSVQGYAETLLDSPAAGDQNTREFLEIIVKNARRMTRLTEDLLVLARVESGEQRFQLRPVSPADLLHDAADTFTLVAREAQLELSVEATVEDTVKADPEALHQVLSNLISNAIHYAREGGRILIGARRLERAVEFYVQDFGRGIPSEHLPRLFERFYRVDKTRSRESGGTGLGLAIVKHIVLAHDGQVRAESQLGHGSTFCFTIPLMSTEASPQTAPAARRA